MNMTEHVRRELELLGEEPDVVDWYCTVIDAFRAYGHSGGSASVAIPTLHKLLCQEALSPLTDSPAEWQDRSVESGYPLWQNCRDSRAMSEDAGRTYWLVDDTTKTIHHSEPHQ
jgi:hypothetical protein